MAVNYIGILNEYAQGYRLSSPVFTTQRVDGPDHSPRFTGVINMGGVVYGESYNVIKGSVSDTKKELAKRVCEELGLLPINSLSSSLVASSSANSNFAVLNSSTIVGATANKFAVKAPFKRAPLAKPIMLMDKDWVEQYHDDITALVAEYAPNYEEIHIICSKVQGKHRFPSNVTVHHKAEEYIEVGLNNSLYISLILGTLLASVSHERRNVSLMMSDHYGQLIIKQVGAVDDSISVTISNP